MSKGVTAKIQIRVNLDDVWADQFSLIKKYLGAKTSAEVIRILITEKHRHIKKELGDTLDNHVPQD